MVFCRADVRSVEIVRTALEDFAHLSGLVANPAKSHCFLSGVSKEMETEILDILGFKPGTLSVKYLGVPLITTRLRHSDCAPLITRILSRIRLWTSASLTYAGRLQLIKSVLFSIQVYWSSMFTLPASVIRRIEGYLTAFLWKGTSLSHSGAKVAWATVCYPIREGGLGIKRLTVWNKAAILKHIWRLFTARSSTWSMWIHKVLLRGRSFWQVRIPSGASWSWRKILQSRDWCQGWFISCIGDGQDTSLWMDYWLPQGPLCNRLSFRTLSTSGLRWDATVSDIIRDGRWNFPPSCPALQLIWDSITVRPRIGVSDRCTWLGHPSGVFSIDSAWDLLRARRPLSSVHHLLWFPGHVPRHSFILWLATLGRLHTMDRLQAHGIISTSPDCSLCGLARETHEHLFFACGFSSLVWKDVSARTLMTWPSSSWTSFIHWTSTHPWRKGSFEHIISRLVLSATVYFIWYERNNRVFSQRHRSPEDVLSEIIEVVRARILDLGTKFKISPQLRSIWSLPD